ncbi:helix-turn-helix domain-containing protein [Flavobacteriaceae bacterium R38]|nr:helix-turn-helix domain-containing protein [Flavobacteriaceae bacterium R38]
MKNKEILNSHYKKNLKIVTNYINDNLNSKIQIEKLASLCNISPFHFHRVLRALLNEPIGHYIVRKRLERAAGLIINTEDKVEEIAFDVGYETPTSFSKQFKKHFGISPTDYRNGRKVTTKYSNNMKLNLKIKKAKILNLDDKECIYITMYGEYSTLDFNGCWKNLWSVVKNQKLFTAGIEHIGLPYDDPKTTEVDKIRYDACLVIHKKASVEQESGVDQKTLKGGKFAMFHYTGSYKYLSNVYDYIFREWLFNNDYKLRSEPVREKYINNPERVSDEDKLKTEIYIPIQ